MTASVVAPVIPAPVRRAGHGGRGTTAVRRLPLASPAVGLPYAGDAVYGLGRVDRSGRVVDRAVLAAVGWCGGDRLTVTAAAGVVVVRRDPGGMVTVPARVCLVIPGALRRRCGLAAGDRVLLAAFAREGTLVAYPLAVVDQAIRAHVPFPRAEGGRS